MSNMAYCRFQNTLNDLIDCAQALYDIDGNLAELSKEEQRAASRLLEICKDLYFDFVEGTEHES